MPNIYELQGVPKKGKINKLFGKGADRRKEKEYFNEIADKRKKKKKAIKKIKQKAKKFHKSKPCIQPWEEHLLNDKPLTYENYIQKDVK